jgi:hypothetical protein
MEKEGDWFAICVRDGHDCDRIPLYILLIEIDWFCLF